MSWYGYPEYVSVAERKKKIQKKLEKLSQEKKDLQPVVIEGKFIAKTFCGKAWCKNIESYKDYAYRLDRGRSYVRHGAVVDLKIQSGKINALVCGTRTYIVSITITAATREKWLALIRECSGKINSLVELLQGKLSENIMQIITQPEKGLFPTSKEISFDCSCPDSAQMCKHVSAVLYGIGNRFDKDPENLFMLRSVDHAELLASSLENVKFDLNPQPSESVIQNNLSDLFGIEIQEETKQTLPVMIPIIMKKKTTPKSKLTKKKKPTPKKTTPNKKRIL